MGYQRWYSVLLLAAISNAETTTSPTAVPNPKPSDVPTSVPTSLPTPDPTGKPSRDPTSLPTSEPTTPPTSAPTKTPTTAPTSKPSIVPTSTPTYLPTGVPTGKPSAVPTFSQPPSASPTSKPTGVPTAQPSGLPTVDPTIAPTYETWMPTQVPTGKPSGVPTSAPTASPPPSEAPTIVPTSSPTPLPSLPPTSSVPSSAPTKSLLTLEISMFIDPHEEPTPFPSAVPTADPSFAPTSLPSHGPSVPPTSVPSSSPTSEPTAAPSSVPTSLPSSKPSATPTGEPTALPTVVPTPTPTGVPTSVPTHEPSEAPTFGPTSVPSSAPTNVPSSTPSKTPTTVPTPAPTYETDGPSAVPTSKPTSEPTFTLSPTSVPTGAPTKAPTNVPSSVPTSAPTSEPTREPTVPPTSEPTNTPTTAPTAVPSPVPVPSPTSVPSSVPTALPTSTPTSPPSRPPTIGPTHVPTSFPSGEPTGVPTTSPTSTPTAVPTSRPSSIPTILPFGIHYCQDYVAFDMEQYYKPVIQEITRAQSVPSVTCQSIGTHPGVHAGAPGGWNGPSSVAPEGKWDNDTAVLIAVTNFYATDEIDRDDPSKASTVFEVGDNVTWRMNRAIFKSVNQHQATFNRKMKMRIRNSFGGSRTRKRQLSDAAQAHVASLDGRTARNLQGAQYEMDYAYNASSALHFVDAANITWVTTEVVGSIAPSGVPTADPTATPTTPPSPEPTGVPTGTPTALPTTLPSPLPTPYPTAMCPSWATREGCAPNCLCCASYSEAKYRKPHETFYNEHMEKDFDPSEPDQCLMCDHGFECKETEGDGQRDGDGTCVEKADYAYEGENMCDWWKWAYRYGPNKTETGPYATNWKTGHAYAEDGSLPKKWYSINGKNCSKWDVDVVSTDKCKGLFHYCNETHCDESTASGHKTLKHDREGTICYSDYRAPDFVGYCSYEVGPSHCARCVQGACGKGACVQASLGFELGGAAGDKTPDELTADPVFTGGLKRSIAAACGFEALGLSEDNIKDLVISYGRRRLEVDEAGAAVEQRRLQTAFSVSYTIVYDPDVVAISVDEIAETVTAAAEEAIDEGSFITALDEAMTEVTAELVAANVITATEAAAAVAAFVGSVVITETVVTILSTEAPTFWSDTEENMEPVIVSRRQGGVAVSDLPACGCDDDTTA